MNQQYLIQTQEYLANLEKMFKDIVKEYIRVSTMMKRYEQSALQTKETLKDCVVLAERKANEEKLRSMGLNRVEPRNWTPDMIIGDL